MPKEKSCTWLVDFDKIPKKVLEWAMRKKNTSFGLISNESV